MAETEVKEEWKSHSQGGGAWAETNWRIQDRHCQKMSVEHAPGSRAIRVESDMIEHRPALTQH